MLMYSVKSFCKIFLQMYRSINYGIVIMHQMSHFLPIKYLTLQFTFIWFIYTKYETKVFLSKCYSRREVLRTPERSRKERKRI